MGEPYKLKQKKMQKIARKLAFGMTIVLLSLVAFACQHNSNNPDNNNNNNNNNTGSGCNPDTVYFVNEILPLVQSSCAKSGCHDAASRREGVVLDKYANIMKIVSAQNPSRSKLYTVLSGTGENAMPPSASERFSKDQKQLIYDWISQGAKNNECKDACDTTTYGFKDQIQPILTKYCAGCHGTSGGQSGVNMVGYDNVILSADNGKLLGTIKGKSGMPLMPPGNPLGDCEITLIEKWVKAGAINN